VEIIAASPGSEAIRQFQDGDGNLGAILIDHDLPNLNGVEFARTVRALGFKGRILIVSVGLSVSDLLRLSGTPDKRHSLQAFRVQHGGSRSFAGRLKQRR